MRNRILYVIVFLVTLSCINSLPKDVLPPKKMIPILVDIHLAQAINEQKFNLSITRDSLPEDLYLSICKKYKIERSVIEKSLLYYGKHTREYMPVYDRVLDVLNEMEVKAKSDTVRPVHVGGFDLDTTKIKKSPPPVAKPDIAKK